MTPTFDLSDVDTDGTESFEYIAAMLLLDALESHLGRAETEAIARSPNVPNASPPRMPPLPRPVRRSESR